MSFIPGIVRTVTGSLKLFTSRVKPKSQFHQGVTSREPMIEPLHDPRFTKEQSEHLVAKAASAQHPPR